MMTNHIVRYFIFIIFVLIVGVFVYNRQGLLGLIFKDFNKTSMQNISIKKDIDNFFENTVAQYVKIGEERFFTQIPGLKIKLLDVLDDGRCPSDVECAHSGHATVLVEASYENEVDKKEIHIRGGNPDFLMPPEKQSNVLGSGNIISVDQYTIYLAALNPYPVTTRKTDKNEYIGTFFVKNNI